MKTILTVLGAVLAFLWACQQQPGGFETLSVDDFRSLIDDPSVQRLDVRTTAEYTEGHIPGSLNINVLDSQFAPMADSLLQKDRPVAVYCRSGKRSKKAAEVLTRSGYRVYELATGFLGWQAAGGDVEK